MPDLNEHIVEVRYKPNPKVLDYRGSWAKVISEHMKLSEWEIVGNRIDIYDKENKAHVFVGFKNAGFVERNTATKSDFIKNALKLFRFLFTLNGFEKTLYVNRLGVRSKFCKEYFGSFDELKKKYTSNYLSLTPKAKEVIDSELLDIGGPLNFVDKHGKFNTMSGPMITEQMKTLFNKTKEFPKVGLYFDIDYWLEPARELNKGEILEQIKQFANSAWERFNSISELVLGE